MIESWLLLRRLSGRARACLRFTLSLGWDLDTIRLQAGEAAGTGAHLHFELVVSSRGRFTRPAASNGSRLA
jgi:hypothetical protein